jgi:hypothetical protein
MIFFCSSVLLIIAFLGNIVDVAGCSCFCLFRPDTICSALLDTKVLVWGTIQSKTKMVVDDVFSDPASMESITYSYEVILKTVYVNADKLEDLAEDQIIEIIVNVDSNMCGVEFETESDMLPELSNDGHYSTNS